MRDTHAIEPVKITATIEIPPRELRWRFSRSSGPGGQAVNTADSRVELSLDLSRTTALGPVQRARVMERLARILASALAPPPPRRRPTRPTRGAVERRLADKKRRSRAKRDRRATDD